MALWGGVRHDFHNREIISPARLRFHSIIMALTVNIQLSLVSESDGRKKLSNVEIKSDNPAEGQSEVGFVFKHPGVDRIPIFKGFQQDPIYFFRVTP